MDNIGDDQAGGVLQVAGEAQHAAPPWLGQVQTQGEGACQLHYFGLIKSSYVFFVITRPRYMFSSNNML